MNYHVKFHKWSLTLIATNLSVIVAPVGLWPILGNRISKYGIFSKTTTTTMSWVWPCWEREASLQLTMCSGEGLWWDHLDAQWVYKIIAQIQYVETTRNDTCIRHYFPCNRSLTKTKVQILLPWENWTSGSEIWSLWCQKLKLSCSCRLIALIHHMLVQIDSTFTSQEACRGPSREDCHDQHWGRLHPCHQALDS